MCSKQLNETVRPFLQVQADSFEKKQYTVNSLNRSKDANEDLLVAQKLIKTITTGIDAQNKRTQKLLMALKKAATGQAIRSGLNKSKVMDYCNLFGLSTKNKSLEELADNLAEKMLDDITRVNPDVNATLEATVPPERKMVWNNLGICPAGATYEISRLVHDESIGTQRDLNKVMNSIYRIGITFLINSVGCASIAQDCVYGLPQRITAKATPEVLQSNNVSIVLSCEDSNRSKELIVTAQSNEFVQQAKQVGAKGIRVYAVSRSNPSAMEHSEGII